MRAGVEAGVVEHVVAPSRGGDDRRLLIRAQRRRKAHHGDAAAGRARDEALQRRTAGEREPALADHRLVAGDVQHDAHMVGPGAGRVGHLAKRVGADAREHDVADLQGPAEIVHRLGGRHGRGGGVVQGVDVRLGEGVRSGEAGAQRGDDDVAGREGERAHGVFRRPVDGEVAQDRPTRQHVEPHSRTSRQDRQPVSRNDTRCPYAAAGTGPVRGEALRVCDPSSMWPGAFR